MEISIRQTPEPLPPAPGEGNTYQDVVAWGLDTRNALRQCNGDKQDIERLFNELVEDEDTRERN